MLEMIIAAFLLTTFVVQLGAIWAAINRHWQNLADRAAVDREVRAVRALILSDLVPASSVSVTSDRLQLHYTNPSLSDITYMPTGDGKSLVRMDVQGNYVIGAAKYLHSAQCSLGGDGSLSASWSFRKGTASADLNLFQAFVSPS